tara:strand:- start:543 stop:689 length:147 start_codon:yes stop_codon:yes gene_type:complete
VEKRKTAVDSNPRGIENPQRVEKERNAKIPKHIAYSVGDIRVEDLSKS